MFGRVARWSVDCNTDNFDASQKMEAHTQARSLDAEERAAKQQKISEAVKKHRKNRRLIYYDRKHGAGT